MPVANNSLEKYIPSSYVIVRPKRDFKLYIEFECPEPVNSRYLAKYFDLRIYYEGQITNPLQYNALVKVIRRANSRKRRGLGRLLKELMIAEQI